MIDLLGLRGEEQFPELRWQGEGDHEIGRADAFAEFALNPRCGGIFTTLRAGAVIAGVEVELAGNCRK